MLSTNTGMRIGLVIVLVGAILSVAGYMITTRSIANANTQNGESSKEILSSLDRKVDGLIYYELDGDKELLKSIITK